MKCDSYLWFAPTIIVTVVIAHPVVNLLHQENENNSGMFNYFDT